MKTLLSFFVLLLAGNALAGEFTEFGRIHFQSASTWVPANKVCQRNGFYYHSKKDSVAVEHCPGDDNPGSANCKVTYKKLEQPMMSTRKRCAATDSSDRGECVKWEIIPYKQGPIVPVNIYDSLHSLEENRAPKAVRSFTIPNCF
jgi:hypothetical protein